MMAKRLLDIMVSALGLLVLSPVLIVLSILVAADGGPPIYGGVRVGRGNRDFRMFKFRTMSVGADRAGGTSTAKSDVRVTGLGHVLRRWKLDELPQLANVLAGQMSLVGPRPNTRAGGVDRYGPDEMGLLKVRPGITDLASIVFADEGDILEGSPDPDAAYDVLIRPWKSRLGSLYIRRRTFVADLRIIALTVLAMIARPATLRGVDRLLEEWGADAELRRVCERTSDLAPSGSPGVAAR